MRVRTLFATGAVALAAALLWALPAQAQETIYWNNYDGNSIAYANVDGTGGGELNTAGAPIEEAEGLSYDSVTGRLYVASSGNDSIVWVNLDGSGAGTLSAPGAPIEQPEGIAVDPATRIVYWVNTEGNGAAEGSIAWARLDGSAGGMLNTAGATLSSPYRLAIDPMGGRVYWTNFGTTPNLISYANLDNSGGGGDLDVSGASEPNDNGLVIDRSAGRIYWLNSESISYASLGGGSGGDLNVAGAVFEDPYGAALDPAVGRILWGNYQNGTEPVGAFGFAALNGSGGGGLNIATAPVDGPQDPVILKSPGGTGAPQVSGGSDPGSVLGCSQGSWAPDLAGAFLYQAPASYSYQWTLNGAPIAGANSSLVLASNSGDYVCSVTAANHEGSATQSSAAFRVAPAPQPVTTPPDLVLRVRPRRGHTRAGRTTRFRAIVRNVGGTTARGARVCVRVPRRQRRALRTPRCRRLAAIAPGGRRIARIGVHARRRARGAYRLVFRVRRAGGAGPVRRKLIVRGHRRGRR